MIAGFDMSKPWGTVSPQRNTKSFSNETSPLPPVARARALRYLEAAP
jgi:hypothetical protein